MMAARLNLDYIESIASGDDQFVKEMIVTLFEESKISKEAFIEAQKNKNEQDLINLAHKNKSSFKNFGLDELSDKLAELETKIKLKQDYSLEFYSIMEGIDSLIGECKEMVTQ